MVLVFAVGCGSADTSSPVISVDENDAAMNAAIAKAGRTLGFFVDNWQTMDSDSIAFKAQVDVDGGGIEHIWFTPVSVNLNQLVGICANEPRNVSGLKMGDQRTFSRDQLSDWMILDGNRCHGGYTIEVMAKIAPDDAPPFEFISPAE